MSPKDPVPSHIQRSGEAIEWLRRWGLVPLGNTEAGVWADGLVKQIEERAQTALDAVTQGIEDLRTKRNKLDAKHFIRTMKIPESIAATVGGLKCRGAQAVLTGTCCAQAHRRLVRHMPFQHHQLVMKKLALGCLTTAIGIVAFFVGAFLVLGKHETWIRPNISGQVLASDSGPLAEIRVVASQNGEKPVKTATDEKGRFSFDAIKKMRYSLPGDAGYVTELSCEARGYKSATVKVWIGTIELIGERPPSEARVQFVLAPTNAPHPSVVGLQQFSNNSSNPPPPKFQLQDNCHTDWIGPDGRVLRRSDSSAAD